MFRVDELQRKQLALGVSLSFRGTLETHWPSRPISLSLSDVTVKAMSLRCLA